MLLLVGLLAAAAPTPTVVVVHDGALPEAKVAAARLQASGKVLAILREEPLPASCAMTTACPDRPQAEMFVGVGRTGNSVRIALIDKSGAVVEREAVDVADSALLDAALAPLLDRIAERAANPPTSQTAPSPSSSSQAAAGEGGGAMPWILGTLGVCGGLCVLGLGGLMTYGLVVSAQAAGQSAGDACGSALNEACTAPFDAVGSACNGIGDSCTANVDLCSGLGDSLSGACDGLGSIGSCAAPALAATAAMETGDARLLPGTTRAPTSTGAMAF